MVRGVDTELFTPFRRTKAGGPLSLGFVGRISPEKNVRFLAQLESAVLAAGVNDFQFVVVGDGSELRWLKNNLRKARFTGVLRGEELARAYADMDIFVFPSQTDTFGNVILEAQASGVPAVVTSQGGPRFIVEQGRTGFIAGDDQDFIRLVLFLMSHAEFRKTMAREARVQAKSRCWARVCERVYDVYAQAAEQAGGDTLVDFDPLLS
jgi:glycosyltransferase involved in cell wall biosynthesis